MFESGVKSYFVCKAEVKNAFPIAETGAIIMTCRFCQYYRQTANRCGLTSEIIYMAEKYVGFQCPLKPYERNDGGDEIQKSES